MKVVAIIKEVSAGVAHTSSALLNTTLFGGDMFTSTSARAHMETHDEVGEQRPNAPKQWVNRRRWINRMFFWQEDHCKKAWQSDYDRALDKFFANINL
jgi:hypothetical protein